MFEIVIGLVVISLSVEVIEVGVLALCLVPLSEEVIVVWLNAHPSKCRGDCYCA